KHLTDIMELRIKLVATTLIARMRMMMKTKIKSQMVMNLHLWQTMSLISPWLIP
ncbi:hypothetical protein E2562_032607, partial [Oryza meyeriana var. granulata]